MKAIREAEKSMSSAWRRGLRSGLWTEMESAVAASLLEAYGRGRGLFLPESNDMGDMTAFFERARAMVHRVAVESEGRRNRVSDLYGGMMLEAIYLLFFDEDDPAAWRPIARGVPASVAARARRAGVTMETARTAHEIVTGDADARVLVRTLPSRSENVALDEVRRAVNMGIVSSALGEMPAATGGGSAADAAGVGAAPAEYEPRYPLWEISEMMDERTRGNPSGIYRDDGFHWQVNGYVNTMAEIVRQGCVPPCGKNCRAVLRPVSWRKAERLGLVSGSGIDYAALRAYNGARQGYIDRGQYPDRGFR